MKLNGIVWSVDDSLHKALMTISWKYMNVTTQFSEMKKQTNKTNKKKQIFEIVIFMHKQEKRIMILISLSIVFTFMLII